MNSEGCWVFVVRRSKSLIEYSQYLKWITLVFRKRLAAAVGLLAVSSAVTMSVLLIFQNHFNKIPINTDFMTSLTGSICPWENH